MLVADFQHGLLATQIADIEKTDAGIRCYKHPGARQLGTEKAISRFGRAGPLILAIHHQHNRELRWVIGSGAVNLQVVGFDREPGRGHTPFLDIALVAGGECLLLPLIRDRVARTECVALHGPVRGRKSLHIKIEQYAFFSVKAGCQ